MSTKNLFSYWASSYYTFPLSIATALVGFIFFLLKKDTQKTTQLFIYYFASYFLLNLIFSASALISKKPLHITLLKVNQFADYFFTLIEFLIFSLFFRKNLSGLKFKKILAAIKIIFILTGVLLLFRDIFLTGLPQLKSTYLLYNLQAISLLIPCIFYYIEIFRLKPTLNLLEEPSFWVVTGVSFFMITTFPFSLAVDYLHGISENLARSFFTLFYIFYTLLFLMIIKGHLCKPTTK